LIHNREFLNQLEQWVPGQPVFFMPGDQPVLKYKAVSKSNQPGFEVAVPAAFLKIFQFNL
jgi:hypothetical protein